MHTFTITFHDSLNYGAFLQSFALQKYIPDSKILGFSPGPYHCVGSKGRLLLPVLWRIIAQRRWKKRNHDKFDEYSRLSVFGNYDNASKTRLKHINEATFVVGSDQIWNPRYVLGMEQIYFANIASVNAKRVSYAASLGMKKWPKDFESKVLPYLKQFDFISVREESSVNYLKSLGLKNVVCVCDPTILHNGDFYCNEFELKKENHKSTFTYRIREKIPEYISDIIEESRQQGWINRVTDLKDKQTICSVTKWLSNIYNASYVITDSFHCVVFCLLFHVPFVVLANHGIGQGMNERFQTLLGKTGLLYRILDSNTNKENVDKLLKQNIDWQKIDILMNDWRIYSASWLNSALKKRVEI